MFPLLFRLWFSSQIKLVSLFNFRPSLLDNTILNRHFSLNYNQSWHLFFKATNHVMLDIIGLTHMELYISFEQLKVGDDKKNLISYT